MATVAPIESQPFPALTSTSELHCQVLNAIRDIDQSRLRLGELFHQVQLQRAFEEWGYRSFRCYVEAECKLSLRTAQSLVKVHNVFVSQLKMTDEEFEAIGWSKAQVIATVIEQAADDSVAVGRILDHARNLSIRKLRKLYRRARERSRVSAHKSCREVAGEPTGESKRKAALEHLSAMILVAPRSRWPEPPDEFAIRTADWQQLCLSMASSRHTLITGPSGSGKTEIARRCAMEFDRPFRSFNVGAFSEARTSIIGITKYSPDKGTYFVESNFVKAITTPNCCVLLDEVNRDPRAFNMLLPVLDGQRVLSLDEDPEIPVVHLAENVHFFATANIGNEYHGTDPIDKAFKDRFCCVIPLWFPDVDDEIEILLRRVNGLSEKAAKDICLFANRQRELWEEGDFAEVVSTRSLIGAAEQIPHGFSIAEALTYSVVNHFSNEGGEQSDRTRLQQLLQRLG